MTTTCTQCGELSPGPGLRIGGQLLCCACGEVWTIPSYPMSTTLYDIQLRRERESEKIREAA